MAFDENCVDFVSSNLLGISKRLCFRDAKRKLHGWRCKRPLLAPCSLRRIFSGILKCAASDLAATLELRVSLHINDTLYPSLFSFPHPHLSYHWPGIVPAIASEVLEDPRSLQIPYTVMCSSAPVPRRLTALNGKAYCPFRTRIPISSL